MQSIKFTSLSKHINYSYRKFPTKSFISLRFKSTQSNELVLVNVNDKTGIALVTLNRPPVNSLNLELLSAFSKTLDDLKTNNSKGMILTSVWEKNIIN